MEEKHQQTEAANGGVKKVLIKISQNSQEGTCTDSLF